MKTKRNFISKSLSEVWQWKEEVSLDIKGKSFKEKKEYYRKGLEEALKILGGKLNRNEDGSYSIV